MTEWINTTGPVISEGTRTISLRTALKSLLECKETPSIKGQSTQVPGLQSSKPVKLAASSAHGVQRAQTNLEDALKSIREQIDKKRKRDASIQRILNNKHEVVNNLYENLNGPLRNVLASDAPQLSIRDPTLLQESNIFQRKQTLYRDKVVKRLTCITGNVQRIEYPSECTQEDAERTLEMSQHESGQILSKSGDLILWRSLRVRNLSDARLFKLRLLLGHDQSVSCVVPCLEQEESALLVSAIVLDRSFLENSLLSAETPLASRLFSEPSLVHMSRNSYNQHPLDDCLVTFAAPTFPFSDHTPASVHSILHRLFPAKTCCP
ncbi:hypothetical protein BGW38_010479 [Lunasporangiospora selenospora]|uniref:Uncharacterized protein n=1 Tax=Lunasporangiospora selenospora TaxID=979761 RepID=A0A9P6KFH6_9FUNG|nr:hypothetical protein BGW38_010479 [Lunasporangiospora selenospora]